MDQEVEEHSERAAMEYQGGDNEWVLTQTDVLRIQWEDQIWDQLGDSIDWLTSSETDMDPWTMLSAKIDSLNIDLL